MQRHWLVVAIGYTAFVVYASLVPLEYKSLTLDEFLARAGTIRYLQLQMYSRADWVANGILFVPVGYAWCATFRRSDLPGGLMLGTCVLLACAIGSIALELLQLLFPIRTVSRNDIYAETFGSGVGIAIWLVFSSRVQNLLRQMWHETATLTALRAAAILYLLGYAGLALLPFDLLLNAAELAHRLETNPPVWIPTGCTALRCVINLSVEVLAAAPLALLLIRFEHRSATHLIVRAAALGAVVGGVLELLQILTFSGSVAWFSVVTRAAGAALGAAAWVLALRTPMEQLLRAAASIATVAIVPYLALLVYANGWQLRMPITDPLELLRRLSELHYVPFHYHYYNTEEAALRKILVQMLMYGPVGVYWFLIRRHQLHRSQWQVPGFIAAGMAVLVAIGRLALDGGGPDPTNVLVAFAAAGGTAYGLRVLYSRLQADAPRQTESLYAEPTRTAPEGVRRTADPEPPEPAARWDAGTGMAWSLVLGTLLALSQHPVTPIPLVVAMATYALLLRRYPRAWLVVVPAAIPALDLGMRSGLFLFDELDALLLITVANGIALSRDLVVPAAVRTGRLLFALFALWCTIATIDSLWAADPSNWGSLLGYDAPQNALRVLKGIIWPMLLWPSLLWAAKQGQRELLGLVAIGAVLGLVGSAAWLVWERLVFTGLFDFETAWRAAGGLSSMRIGGASLDVLLVLALPFLAYAWTHGRVVGRLLAVPATLLAFYAVFITFTRTTYVAAVLVVLWLLFCGMLQLPGSRLRRAAMLAGVGVVLGLMVLAPVLLGGSFMQSRWKGVDSDLATRSARLVQTVESSASTFGRAMFGEGLGRYPAGAFQRAIGSAAPSRVRLIRDDGNWLLRMEPGESVYVDQWLVIEPLETYTVQLDVRAAAPTAMVALLCEKHSLNSLACVGETLQVQGEPGTWVRLKAAIPSRILGLPRGFEWMRPTTYLTLTSPGKPPALEIDNVSVTDMYGRQMLQNGDFEAGTKHWTYTQDDHLFWQPKNLWLFLLAELGLTGCLGMVLLIAYVGVRLMADVGRGSLAAAILSASILAGMVMGLTDSIFNEPRPTILFFLVIQLSVVLTSPLRPAVSASSAQASGGRPMRRHFAHS